MNPFLAGMAAVNGCSVLGTIDVWSILVTILNIALWLGIAFWIYSFCKKLKRK